MQPFWPLPLGDPRIFWFWKALNCVARLEGSQLSRSPTLQALRLSLPSSPSFQNVLLTFSVCSSLPIISAPRHELSLTTRVPGTARWPVCSVPPRGQLLETSMNRVSLPHREPARQPGHQGGGSRDSERVLGPLKSHHPPRLRPTDGGFTVL